jgi:hypothetical protein
MTPGLWREAESKTISGNLYSMQPIRSDAEREETRRAEKRHRAEATLSRLWPDGYVSYIFSVTEPPNPPTAKVSHAALPAALAVTVTEPLKLELTQERVYRREGGLTEVRTLFLFTPKLCPQLFDSYKPLDIWKHLKSFK